jgi:hypothetical protein
MHAPCRHGPLLSQASPGCRQGGAAWQVPPPDDTAPAIIGAWHESPAAHSRSKGVVPLHICPSDRGAPQEPPWQNKPGWQSLSAVHDSPACAGEPQTDVVLLQVSPSAHVAWLQLAPLAAGAPMSMQVGIPEEEFAHPALSTQKSNGQGAPTAAGSTQCPHGEVAPAGGAAPPSVAGVTSKPQNPLWHCVLAAQAAPAESMPRKTHASGNLAAKKRAQSLAVKAAEQASTCAVVSVDPGSEKAARQNGEMLA